MLKALADISTRTAYRSKASIDGSESERAVHARRKYDQDGTAVDQCV